MEAAISKKSDEEIRDASHIAMVRLTKFAIFGMLKKVSLAVGVVDLKETYEQVLQMAGEEDIAARLIDLSIKLDHFWTYSRDRCSRARASLTHQSYGLYDSEVACGRVS
jgi:hypothetical protein